MEAIITFRAGRCEANGKRIKPINEPGYIYLYMQDDCLHFSWRNRASPSWDPALDLLMFPGDCTFLPYIGSGKTFIINGDNYAPTNGRIFELRFQSSSQRHYFWLQSLSLHPEGNPSWFSKRDLLLGEIVNKILADESADITRELLEFRRRSGGGGGGNNGANGSSDDAMEDVEEETRDLQRRPSGGAGQDATGGDPREEGEDSRRGGADGGRAAPGDANALVQNFLQSLQGSNLGQSQAPSSESAYGKPFANLPELFNSNTTIAYLSSASPAELDRLCGHLPASIFLLAQESSESLSSAEPTPEAGRAAIEALSTEQKREILGRVLRSPQLHQSLGSLTQALREGGLPEIGEALQLNVENGGLIKGGSMPYGGGEAVEKFMDGVKRSAGQQ